MRWPLVLPVFFLCAVPGAVAETATLQAPARIGINAKVEIAFDGPEANGDYLQFVDAAGEPVRGAYQYVGNARDGKVALRAPLEPGEYELGYFDGASRTALVTMPIVVEPVSATVTAPGTVDANATIEVSFDGPDNEGDYLQFVDTAGNAVRGSYQYAGNARDGVVKLRAPVEPGSYTVAYFTGKKDIGSTPVVVGGVTATLGVEGEVPAGAHFDVAWEGPNNSGDRVDLLVPDGKRASSYAYVGNHPDGVLQLRAPEVPGTYRIAYWTANQIIGETTVTVLDVTAEISAPATVVGSSRFTVNWDGPGNYGDTIQLVVPGTDEDLAYAYIVPDDARNVALAAPETPGAFELRYVTHGRRVLATRAIEVTPPVELPGSLAVVASSAIQLGPDDAVEVVLDASGSMLQRQNGERRIDIAKRTLDRLLRETIPEGTPFAMRVFGHQEADKCRTDLEIPLAPLSAAAADRLAGINAMNLARTPIAESLELTAADLRTVTGERIIVLVTDGEETCDGDPAAAIAGLRAQGHDLRVSIVGYAIDDEGLRDTFARWANLGGGEYFDAAGEADLTAALVNSVRPSFVVTDSEQIAIARGIAGGEPIVLPPGSYTVIAGRQSHEVQVLPEQRVNVTLD
ncbi:MAG: VWA domain-containing protein [Gammaproteobacteria bacterium]|nr:VWA domain-containing protein [Gammaproteobacteria bacterium]